MTIEVQTNPHRGGGVLHRQHDYGLPRRRHPINGQHVDRLAHHGLHQRCHLPVGLELPEKEVQLRPASLTCRERVTT